MLAVMNDRDQEVAALARRPWRTPRLPPLVGYVEACEILGVQKMALSRWLRPGSGINTPWGGFGPDKTYMITPARIRSGPVWDRRDVERFANEIGRQRAPTSSPQRASQARIQELERELGMDDEAVDGEDAVVGIPKARPRGNAK